MTDFHTLAQAGRDFASFVQDALPAEQEAVKGYQAKLPASALPEAVTADLAAIEQPVTLLVAGEIWCPDCQRNISAMALMSQLQPLITLKIISKGRAEKGLKLPLGLESIPVPTVAVLDSQFQLLGKFVERPRQVIEGDNATLEAYKRGERLLDVITDLLQVIHSDSHRYTA